jgi:hypothetical protein
MAFLTFHHPHTAVSLSYSFESQHPLVPSPSIDEVDQSGLSSAGISEVLKALDLADDFLIAEANKKHNKQLLHMSGFRIT